MAALTPPKMPPAKSKFVESEGTCKQSLGWFVESAQTENGVKAFVARGNCEVTPLVNGEKAFGTLEKAIIGATHSIDYLTWGFDPAMRMSKEGGRPIGEILLEQLEKKSALVVRLLIWYPGPGWAAVYGQSDSGKDGQGQDFNTANMPGYSVLAGKGDKYEQSASLYARLEKHPRIQLHTRAMDSADVGKAISNNTRLTPTVTGWLDLDADQETVLKTSATHHQKMVLIDYDQPAKARGFVLGSNTLQRYWDTNDHPVRHPNRRIDYFEPIYRETLEGVPVVVGQEKKTVYLQPWQDISAEVKGEILFDLNVNFTRAWKRAGGAALEPGRDKITPEAYTSQSGYPVQVVRTQPQEGSDHSISDAYFQNVLHARDYIYFENQYFRLPELMRHLGGAGDKQAAWGCKQRLYLFVVTNAPDKYGRMTTYQTLKALGKGDQDHMPEMANSTKADKAAAQEPLPATQGEDNAALQAVVCTLTASDGTQTVPIYVHSKLMIIDDTYFTLGSANLNRRSFASDSELNVSVPCPDEAAKLRTGLWHAHRGDGPLADFKEEFKEWEEISAKNLKAIDPETKRLNDPEERLKGRLTQFFDNGPAVTTVYD